MKKYNKKTVLINYLFLIFKNWQKNKTDVKK